MLCGKLVPPGHMLRHNDQYHTAPEERRYKCEVCSKDFENKSRNSQPLYQNKTIKFLNLDQYLHTLPTRNAELETSERG